MKLYFLPHTHTKIDVQPRLKYFIEFSGFSFALFRLTNKKMHSIKRQRHICGKWTPQLVRWINIFHGKMAFKLGYLVYFAVKLKCTAMEMNSIAMVFVLIFEAKTFYLKPFCDRFTSPLHSQMHLPVRVCKQRKFAIAINTLYSIFLAYDNGAIIMIVVWSMYNYVTLCNVTLASHHWNDNIAKPN